MEKKFLDKIGLAKVFALIKDAFYTKSEIDDKLTKIAGGGSIDLDGYVKKEELQQNYYTKTNVDEKFATKDELKEYDDTDIKKRLGVLEAIDHTQFAEKTELSNYYTKAEIGDNYYDKDTIDNKLKGIGGTGGNGETPSLDGYATEDWVEKKGYATEDWVKGQGYLIEIPEEYAKKSDIPTDYLTEDDLSDYATQEWVGEQGYLTDDDVIIEDTKIQIGDKSIEFIPITDTEIESLFNS